MQKMKIYSLAYLFGICTFNCLRNAPPVVVLDLKTGGGGGANMGILIFEVNYIIMWAPFFFFLLLTIYNIYVVLFLLYILRKPINPLIPFIFRFLLLVHYFSSNFQLFPTVNTIGHIVHEQKCLGKKLGQYNWGRGANH